jgi:hypothetical protein
MSVDQQQAHYRSPNKRAILGKADAAVDHFSISSRRRSSNLVRQGLPVLVSLSVIMVLLFSAVLHPPQVSPLSRL